MSLYSLTAGTQGTVLAIGVAPGDRVAAAQVVMRLEIMKMEIPVEAQVAGCVASIHVRTGEFVKEGDPLLMIETDPGALP
jgi:acetyl-CoA carboxylase biotin carboxyl carrier protein